MFWQTFHLTPFCHMMDCFVDETLIDEQIFRLNLNEGFSYVCLQPVDSTIVNAVYIAVWFKIEREREREEKKNVCESNNSFFFLLYAFIDVWKKNYKFVIKAKFLLWILNDTLTVSEFLVALFQLITWNCLEVIDIWRGAFVSYNFLNFRNCIHFLFQISIFYTWGHHYA